ncbi:MAG TPA: ATP synthase F0 subunit B [candidate division Zixibacteria bacterium]|nr:ATP synthase F0 subunit B [candidate division Zixibacteria bacterium]
MTFLGVLGGAVAWASAAGEAHEPSPGGILFPAINFLLYAGVLAYYALPLVLDYLRTRREEISAALEDAAESKQRAEAALAEYRSRLARLGEEAAALQASLRTDGEREKARLLNEATALAAKIREDARFLGEQEVKVARQQIRSEMAERAAATARTLIEQHMSEADRERLVEDFMQEIGQVR